MSMTSITPTFTHEAAFWARGHTLVAGVDEAGRGAWAGPVVVAAVILPAGERHWPYRDSKTLSAARRDALAEDVKRSALAWAVEHATAQEVDQHNVLGATKRAALRAVARLQPAAQALITDYLHLNTPLPLIAPAKADRASYSVAAASLLAKTARDQFMRDLHEHFPQYAFHAHKGYGAPAHQRALAEHGPCPEHRRSFKPVMQLPLFDRPPAT